MEHIIVIDVGTSSLKAMLYNIKGELLFKSSREYHSEFFPGNRVEQDPLTWKNSLFETMKDTGSYVNAKKISVSAIAVTSQRASVIPMDKDGNALYNALMWQDKRSIAQCDNIFKQQSMADVYFKTGLRVNPYFCAPKMMWLKDEEKGIVAKTVKFVGVQDYVTFNMTGTYATDWSQACRTLLMNISTFAWDPDMLKIAGISASELPDLIPPGAVAGNVTKAFSAATGITEGIPVILGGGDQQCAALALDVLQPGYSEVNTGTGSFLIAYSEKPKFDDQCRTLCSAAAMPGKWIVEAGVFNSGAVHRWFKEQFYQNEENAYKKMDLEVAESPVGANGVMMLAHFEGCPAPYWNPIAKGMFFNLSLGTKRSDLTRAILEGISLEIKHNISLIENLIGKIDTVSVAGGLTSFDLFNQMQADVFDRNVIRYDNNEASSLGALMSAGVTLKIFDDYKSAFKGVVNTCPVNFKPDKGNAEKYNILFKRKDELYKALNQNKVYDLFNSAF